MRSTQAFPMRRGDCYHGDTPEHEAKLLRFAWVHHRDTIGYHRVVFLRGSPPRPCAVVRRPCSSVSPEADGGRSDLPDLHQLGDDLIAVGLVCQILVVAPTAQIIVGVCLLAPVIVVVVVVGRCCHVDSKAQVRYPCQAYSEKNIFLIPS